MPSLYIVCATGEHDPCLGWLDEALAIVAADRPGWQIEPVIRADNNNTFSPLDVYSTVARACGPVLCIGSLKKSAAAALSLKLNGRALVEMCNPSSSTDIYEAILAITSRSDDGEPRVPIRLAVALMLIAKLENMGYWGGKKNFMSVHKIAKGNGLDESYKTVAQEVAEYLSSDSRTTKLLSKKLGDGNVKYACNGELPDVVYGFLRDRRVSDRQVMHWLHGDLTPVSARELDHITPERYERKR